MVSPVRAELKAGKFPSVNDGPGNRVSGPIPLNEASLALFGVFQVGHVPDNGLLRLEARVPGRLTSWKHHSEATKDPKKLPGFNVFPVPQKC